MPKCKIVGQKSQTLSTGLGWFCSQEEFSGKRDELSVVMNFHPRSVCYKNFVLPDSLLDD
jgi:hypothetical protein